MARAKRSTFFFAGKRYERTGKTQKEADQKAAVLKEQLKRGEIGISGNMTVKKWAEEWLETYKQPSVGEGTYKNYNHIINKVIVPAVGALAIKSVKDVHLQKILNDQSGKSKSFISKVRITMKEVFKRACISRLIQHNPAEHLELPAADDGTHRSITPKERELILSLAKTHYAGLWVKMLLYCGLRPGETRALDWRHIDFDKRLIHVEQAMKAATTDIGTTKSKAGIRDVPIPDKLYNDLLAAKGNMFEPVFKKDDRPYDQREAKPQATGRHDKASMERMWRSFKRELNLVNGAGVSRNKIDFPVIAKDLVPYCLRHTYCTDLQDAGVPINVARYLMGHANISMTAKIYTHTTEKAIQDAADKINRFA